ASVALLIVALYMPALQRGRPDHGLNIPLHPPHDPARIMPSFFQQVVSPIRNLAKPVVFRVWRVSAAADQPDEGDLVTLNELAILLAALALAAPLARWLGIAAVLGYLVAGVLLGPFG